MRAVERRLPPPGARGPVLRPPAPTATSPSTGPESCSHVGCVESSKTHHPGRGEGRPMGRLFTWCVFEDSTHPTPTRAPGLARIIPSARPSRLAGATAPGRAGRPARRGPPARTALANPIPPGGRSPGDAGPPRDRWDRAEARRQVGDDDLRAVFGWARVVRLGLLGIFGLEDVFDRGRDEFLEAQHRVPDAPPDPVAAGALPVPQPIDRQAEHRDARDEQDNRDQRVKVHDGAPRASLRPHRTSRATFFAPAG